MPSRLDLDTFWVPHRIQNRIAMAAQEQLHDMLKIITPPTRNTSFEWPKGSPMAPKMTSKALQKTMPFFISRTVRNGLNLAPSWPQLGAHLAATWANSGQLRINLGQLGPTSPSLRPSWGLPGQFGANLGPTWANLVQVAANLEPTWADQLFTPGQCTAFRSAA